MGLRNSFPNLGGDSAFLLFPGLRVHLHTAIGARAVPGSQHSRMGNRRGINRGAPLRGCWRAISRDGSRSDRFGRFQALVAVTRCTPGLNHLENPIGHGILLR